jgi:PAS domain S-box-containing protein
MLDHLSDLLSSSGFMPHGMCYLWQPGILSLHVISDALITIAYFSIPFTLLYFVRKRRDLQFNWMFVCFAVFIVACGTTHLLEILTVWKPVYWLSGGVKAITALASVPTAILLVRLIPQALAIPSPAALHREIAERRRAEDEVRRTNEALEARVAARTAQLEEINRALRDEVAQRLQAEETMRSSRQMLEAVINNSMAVIYVKGLDGRYLLVNRRFEEIFHLEAGAMLGRTDYDLFEREAADTFRAMDQRVIALDRAITEEELAPEPGGPRTYISVKAPLRDPTGEPYAIFGISTDITDRKRMEDRLLAQLAHMRLLDQTTKAIGEHQDLKSIYRIVLSSVEDHLFIDFACVCVRKPDEHRLTVSCIGPKSLQPAALIGMAEESGVDVDENGLARCLYGELVYEPDISTSSFDFPRRLAQAGMRSLVIAPLSVESKAFGVMVCARRVPENFSSSECELVRQLAQHVALAAHQTELYESLERAYEDLRQSQQAVLQQERLRALGQMASGIAHDINNALSPAALYTQSLLERDRTLTPQSREQLEIVVRAIEDVADTVARMREFYRPREPQFDHGAVDANRVLQQVVDLTRARWSDMPQERGIVIEMRTELVTDLPPINGADSDIRDAVTNLVLNAVDAMPDGGTLTLRGFRDSPSGRICIEVADTGIGMSDAVRARCLEPFFTTKGERGTGMGLAMVYGMVQRHNADLQIDSESGAGTRIRLLFPSAQAAAAPGPERAPEPPRALRVLLVDDDPLLLRSLQDTLEMNGHTITTAHGGQDGIDSFAAAQRAGNPFEFVITDLGMPHVDGRSVAAAIKSMSAQTPVVLLTGWGHRLLAENDVPKHVDRVLSKPPKLAELKRALSELFGRSRDG